MAQGLITDTPLNSHNLIHSDRVERYAARLPVVADLQGIRHTLLVSMPFDGCWDETNGMFNDLIVDLICSL